MIIEIKALDTLFFRDGKPFSMGDDTWATGMFPPQPSVIYGVIRSLWLSQNDVNVEEVKPRTKNLRIKNFWYKINALNENGRTSSVNYFPLPLDIIRFSDLDKKAKRNAIKNNIYEVFGTEVKSTDFFSNLKELNIINTLTIDSENQIENLKDGIVAAANLEKYLNGHQNLTARELNQTYQTEPKTGIGRSNQTRTAEDGNLYRIGMLRTDNISIFVEFTGLDFNQTKGLIRLGAENKLATYNIVDEDDKPELRSDELNISFDKVFKIYLTTPAIFNNGFYPQDIFVKTGLKVNLLACAVGKSLSVGGFDMVEREPKPMEKAVPAGSVYFYELLEGDIQVLEAEMTENGISESRGGEGFGICYLGKYN